VPGYPAPSRKDHLTFCVNEGWTEVRNATGQAVRHHLTFELSLPDGRILRTHISRPPDSKDTYGPGLWSRILRDQLRVTAHEFWACVQGHDLPDRGFVKPPEESIPADVLTLLVNRGVDEKAVLMMSRHEALALLYALLSKPTQ
jgi:hypothetical protein